MDCQAVGYSSMPYLLSMVGMVLSLKEMLLMTECHSGEMKVW